MLDVRRESISGAAAGWGSMDEDKADGFVKVKCEDCILFSAFLVDNPPVDRSEFIGWLYDFIWLFNLVVVLNVERPGFAELLPLPSTLAMLCYY